ncbi:MAG: enoyl-CoA hydratase/isomerase family protein [Gammaproteobacteria bacterium]|nr:enoyl-CoA hydratase/isomerase family protein [Gammaproteobacteria bacterium]
MSDYQYLTIDSAETIATITLRRPERANALGYAVLQELEGAVLSMRDQPDIRVVVLTGEGRHFSSGADLGGPGPASEPRREIPLVHRRRQARMGGRVIRALLDMDQISIAAWNGAAMGGGGCVATACDFRIAADDAFLCYPEIDIGLNLMWWGLPLITRLAGPSRAKRLVIGGERIGAPVLERWGVVDEVVPRDELMPRVYSLARFYAGKAPIAAQMIKRSVNALSGAFDEAVMHMDFDQNLLTAATDDAALARRTYRTEQTPGFTGN